MTGCERHLISTLYLNPMLPRHVDQRARTIPHPSFRPYPAINLCVPTTALEKYWDITFPSLKPTSLDLKVRNIFKHHFNRLFCRSPDLLFQSGPPTYTIHSRTRETLSEFKLRIHILLSCRPTSCIPLPPLQSTQRQANQPDDKPKLFRNAFVHTIHLCMPRFYYLPLVPFLPIIPTRLLGTKARYYLFLCPL